MRLLKWFRARVQAAGADGVIIDLALVLALPSLAAPIVMDEYAQLLRYREAQQPGGRSVIHTAFVFADPARQERDFERGVGIWWIAPNLKIALWRPLAAATQLVDFRFWPHSALLMHVHTLLTT